MQTEPEGAVDDVSAMMNARAIAVIGASVTDASNKLTSRPVRFLLKHGYKGQIYPVNPKYAAIEGLPCYRSVLDVPGAVDLAAIILPRDRVFKAVEECAVKGVRGLIVFTSGFAEVGEEGRNLQDRLVAFARARGMRLAGPNSAALVNVHDGMVLSFMTGFAGEGLERGNIAFVSNSGALVSTAIRVAAERGFGYSHLIALGNEGDLTLTDFVRFFVEDPQTKVVTAFVEGIKDGKGFLEAAKAAAARRKPILMLKVGRSERAGKVAASHTGAVTGDDRLHSAALRQLGVTRVSDINDLIETCTLFSRYEPPAVPDAAIVCTGSGGAAGLVADLAEQTGLKLAEFSAETREKLATLLTPFSILLNPIDVAGVTADPNEEVRLFRSCLDHLAGHGGIGVIGVVIPVVPYVVEIAQHIVEVLSQVPARPIVPILLGGANLLECLGLFRKHRIPYFSTGEQGIRALKAFQDYAEFVTRWDTEGSAPAAGDRRGPVAMRTRERLEAWQRGGKRVMTLHGAADILASYGFTLPPQGLARSAAEARALAERIGLPVALKVESERILHKSDVQAVRLGVDSPEAVERAFHELMTAAGRVADARDVDGILVQAMIKPHTEVILGCTRDPGLGHAVLVGLGGIFVEVLKDFSLRLPPIREAEARRMLAELRSARILTGYRGRNAADVDALVSAIVSFSRLLEDVGDNIREVDINPLFVLEQGRGAVVGDALFVLEGRESASQPSAPQAASRS